MKFYWGTTKMRIFRHTSVMTIKIKNQQFLAKKEKPFFGFTLNSVRTIFMCFLNHPMVI